MTLETVAFSSAWLTIILVAPINLILCIRNFVIIFTEVPREERKGAITLQCFWLLFTIGMVVGSINYLHTVYTAQQ